MPIRIYALAKELGMDNKQLVDLCEKAGVKGKGSALASLNDDEVAKVKDFISKSSEPKKPEKPVEKVEPQRQEPAPKRADPFQRRSGPMRDLSSRSKKNQEPSESQTTKKDTSKKKPPINVKLAAMPEVSQPKETPKKSKEKVIKPDIALPQDAIRQVKSGAAPLSQFTETSKANKQKKRGKQPAAEQSSSPDILGEMPTKGRTKAKKNEKGEKDFDTDLGSTRQARAKTQRRRSVAFDQDGEENSRLLRRRPKRKSSKTVSTAAPRKEKVTLQLPCTVREFSEAAGIQAGQVMGALMELGIVTAMMEMGIKPSINSTLDEETALLLADHLNAEIELKQEVSLEDKLIGQLDEDDEDSGQLVSRPPIVTFLGHVDHGKTSLLDSIIGINVVKGEAGGITQHIRAYQVEHGDQKIAFVDTPGHEAFTEMRARGANVTDIAVLVVAADDGIMPQTEEAISHAKAAGVPIIVALNKIDLPGVTPDKALQDLASHELLPSEWGGDIEVVRTSAITKEGIDNLLETILVTAELHEYKANFEKSAIGTCLEAEQESGRGVISKLIVQSGTLNVGDVVVCGSAYGRVKAMYDTLNPNKTLQSAGPSTPINLTGLDVAPDAGDKFYVLEDIAQAREIAASREYKTREQSLSGITTRVSLEDFQSRLERGDLKDSQRELVTLNLILRADVRGSIEAIQKELGKIDHPEVRVNILQALVGGVTVADVRLAQASEAVIIGFNVVPDDAARSLADDLQVEIRRYDVIYKVSDDIKATLEGRLKPEEKEVESGSVMVLKTFSISRVGTIAGCRVMRGTIERNCRMRVIRDSRVIGDYAIDTLKREKDDAKEVQRGMECGIKLAGFDDVKEGDSLEAYKIEEVARTL